MDYYKAHFKYYARYRLVVPTGIACEGFELPFCGVTPEGDFWSDRWFGWDGMSWVPDCWGRRASRFHDQGYRLLALTGFGATETFDERRKLIDEMFYKIMLSAGMPKPLAKIYYRGVRVGGGPSSAPRKRKIYTAR